MQEKEDSKGRREMEAKHESSQLSVSTDLKEPNYLSETTAERKAQIFWERIKWKIPKIEAPLWTVCSCCYSADGEWLGRPILHFLKAPNGGKGEDFFPPDAPHPIQRSWGRRCSCAEHPMSCRSPRGTRLPSRDRNPSTHPPTIKKPRFHSCLLPLSHPLLPSAKHQPPERRGEGKELSFLEEKAETCRPFTRTYNLYIYTCMYWCMYVLVERFECIGEESLNIFCRSGRIQIMIIWCPFVWIHPKIWIIEKDVPLSAMTGAQSTNRNRWKFFCSLNLYHNLNI